jgi:hypothetical protein
MQFHEIGSMKLVPLDSIETVTPNIEYKINRGFGSEVFLSDQ